METPLPHPRHLTPPPAADNFGTRRWLTVSEAARYLRLTDGTVYTLFYAGKLPGARVGRSVRIDLKKLDAQMEAQAKGKP